MLALATAHVLRHAGEKTSLKRIAVVAAAILASSAASAFDLTSPDIAPGAKIFDEFVFSASVARARTSRRPSMVWRARGSQELRVDVL